MYDLVVIGAGPGGLSVASAAAKVGAKVALVDKTQPGGGRVSASVPSKGLVQAARLKRQVDEAGAFGIQAGPARVDLPAILARLREVSQTIAARNSDEVLKLLGIDVFNGSPS